MLLINLYNSNNVYEQLNTLSTLCSLLYDIIDLYCKNIIFGGDFNIFFNLTCKACGGNPKMKNKSVAKYILIKESLGLCDIWQIRNLKKKRYTLRQQHFTGFNQRSLDYFLFSNNLQESINKTDILTTLSGDHSPVFISLSIDISWRKVLWKFNNSCAINSISLINWKILSKLSVLWCQQSQ